MGEIFKLFGSIGIKNDEANRKIDETSGKGKRLAATLGKGIKSVGKFALGLGAAAAAGATALMGLATKTAESTDRIDKMSQKLGLTRKGFQEWDFILSQNGTSMESMKMGMKTLNGAFDDLKQGSGMGKEAFDRLGLSYDQLAGKTQEEIFESTIKALQGVEDESERAALANDLLGRSGQELAPLLAAGADSVEELKKKAHELGLVMSDDAIDAGVKFTDTMDQVKRSLGVAFMGIGTEVMPIIQSFLDWVIANMPVIREVFSNVFGGISTFVQTAVNIFNTYLLPVFQAIYDWTITNWPAISETIRTVIDTIKTNVETIFTAIQVFWDTWGTTILAFMQGLWDNIKIIFETVLGVIQGVINTVTSIMRGDWEGALTGMHDIAASIWDGIKNIISNSLEAAKNVISSILGAIRDKFSSIWNGIKSTISEIVDGISSKISSVFNGVKDKISSIFGSIKDTTSTTWENIKTAIQRPIEKARDIVQSAIDKIKGFFDFNISWPSIPMPHFVVNPPGWSIGDLLKGSIPSLDVDFRAKGGIMTKPTIFGALGGRLQVGGEAGPEAVLPISKLQEMVDWNTSEIDYDKLSKGTYHAFVAALEKMNLQVVVGEREIGRIVDKRVKEVLYATNAL